MDVSDIAKKLGLSEEKLLLRKAAELRRLSDIQFDSSVIGVGEICKAIICLEITATRLQVLFDRQTAIRLSGMTEKAYNRSFNCMKNGLGVRIKLDIRELAIQFGCVRIIPFVRKGLSLYKDRFLAALPPSRRATADFTRPVFTAVAFYLCAKKQKLKVDKHKLVEICGTSEPEFSSVSVSMNDLCFDVFGITEKAARDVKGNRELLDVLPEKRALEDGGYLCDEGPQQLSSYKKRKMTDKDAYEDWKSTVLSNKKNIEEGSNKRRKQTTLTFLKKAPASQKLEVSGTIRNCCFDAESQLQNLLLASEFLWPALLLPVSGSKICSKQDTSKMPPELGTALSVEREGISDPEIRVQALEAIYLLSLQDAGQRALWSINGPRILQVGYEEEEDPKVMEAYEQIGSLLVHSSGGAGEPVSETTK